MRYKTAFAFAGLNVSIMLWLGVLWAWPIVYMNFPVFMILVFLQDYGVRINTTLSGIIILFAGTLMYFGIGYWIGMYLEPKRIPESANESL